MRLIFPDWTARELKGFSMTQRYIQTAEASWRTCVSTRGGVSFLLALSACVGLGALRGLEVSPYISYPLVLVAFGLIHTYVWMPCCLRHLAEVIQKYKKNS